MAKFEKYKGKNWEQLGLNFVVDTSPQRQYTCPFIENKPCDTGIYKEDCQPCEKYETKHRRMESFLENKNITDKSLTKYLSYLDFSYWLYLNFKEFSKENEIKTDIWKITKNRKELEVRLCWKVNEKGLREQYVSVSFSKNNDDYYGFSSPCTTLGQVKKNIKQGLKDLNER